MNAVGSFVQGIGVQDGHCHGTNCCGVVGGPMKSAGGTRYGVAPDAELFAGKVLDNQGRGTDDQILDGTSMATVHITLREEVRNDPKTKELAYNKILQIAGLHDVNERRFDRYGILTGELDDDHQVLELQKLPEVSSVEKDSQKYAIQTS